MTQAILTLQSHVAMGHVGLEAARLPLYLAGFDLWALPTVLFSNHPGHGHFKGAHTPQKLVLDMLEGVDQMQNWPLCAGILTGYMGRGDTARLVFEKLRQIKSQNPHVSFCLDPVMGDNDTGLYVADDLPDIFATALDFADILTPNHFELEILAGKKLDIFRIPDRCLPRALQTRHKMRCGHIGGIANLVPIRSDLWPLAIAKTCFA